MRTIESIIGKSEQERNLERILSDSDLWEGGLETQP